MLPSNDEAMLRGSNSSMKIATGTDQIEKEIEVKNNSSKYSYYHHGNSDYTAFEWKVGKGLTEYGNSYAAHREGLKLTLVE